MKCKECGDTGVIVPVIGEFLYELKDWENWKDGKDGEYVMECDYCEIVPNVK